MGSSSSKNFPGREGRIKRDPQCWEGPWPQPELCGAPLSNGLAVALREPLSCVKFGGPRARVPERQGWDTA